MADEPDTTAYSGLKQCLQDFEGAYCYRQMCVYIRKATEFVCSSLFAITSIVLLGLFIYKHRLQRHTWTVVIISLMLLCLIANVLFCLFNQTYWLFALETYFFNLYYLAVVSFVCKAYLLKYRQSAAEDQSAVRKLLPNGHIPQNLSRDRIIFYSVLISMSILYTAIFITSIIYEVDPPTNTDSSNEKYCEQIWYLCFEVFCILLSIIVMVIMYKNQVEETRKILEYEEQFKRRSVGSLISKESFAHSEKMDNYEERAGMINNPLQNLWIWIILNVASQIINLIESGFFLEANPPQCLIIKHNPNSSNVLQLVFVFLTMYMGFIGTLWYNFSINIKNKSVVDRTVHYSQELRVDGNIQLFVPSREQTISFV